MRLAIINPNSTVSMTEKIAAAARATAPGVQIMPITCHGAPPAIQGPEDGALALPLVVQAVVQAAADGADAAVIACFDDPGLAEARAAVTIPVLGVGQAAFHAAMLLGQRFSVVTTLPVAVPVIEGNLNRYGLGAACTRVRAAGVEVLALEDPSSGATDRISAEIAASCAQDAPGAVVLGCAGMADLAAAMQARHGLRVIDGVAAATALAQALVALSA